MNAASPLAPTWQAPSLPGLQLGPEIGRGRVGTVYRATTTEGQSVAVKVVPDSGVSAERFLREARILGNLRHPRVIRCHRAGKADGCLYLVMDLAVSDLHHRLASGPLTEPAALQLMDQIAEGLEVLAAHGIVHRDLSPGNILFTAEGSALIGDFGLAAAADPALTRTGEILGTIAYLSPEQARGETADARSDLYCLGATMYHAVTGQPPVSGGNAWALLRSIASGPDHDPHRIAPHISLQLRTVLRCCLAADPAERYPNASALREDLAAIARGAGPKRAGALRRSPAPVIAAAQTPASALPRLIATVSAGAAGFAMGLLLTHLSGSGDPPVSAALDQALRENAPQQWQSLDESAGESPDGAVARSMTALWARMPPPRTTADGLRSELLAAKRHIAALAGEARPAAAPATSAQTPTPAPATSSPAVSAPAPAAPAPIPAAYLPKPPPDSLLATAGNSSSGVSLLPPNPEPVESATAPAAGAAPLPHFTITDLPLPPQPFRRVNACMTHSTRRDSIIAWGYNGIILTTDGGKTWTAPKIPPGVTLATYAGHWRADRDEIFIPAERGSFGVFSSDGGANFQAIGMPVAIPLPESDRDSLPHLRLSDGRLVCVITHPYALNGPPHESIYVGSPTGRAWQLAQQDPVLLSGLWALRSGMLVARTGKVGTSWNSADPAIAVKPSLSWRFPGWETTDHFYVITQQGSDQTQRRIVEFPLPIGPPRIRTLPSSAWKPSEFQCIVVDPVDPRRWYGTNSSSGLWISRDSGDTFTDFVCVTATAATASLALSAGRDVRLVLADDYRLKLITVQP